MCQFDGSYSRSAVANHQSQFVLHSAKSFVTTLRQERYTTRLYLLLLTVGLTVFLLYNSLAEYTQTVIIEQPTQNVYERLLQSQGLSALKCACSEIAINYGSFVQINTSLHQVCLSSFVGDAWLASLFNSDWSNFTDNNDFRIHGISYFLVVHALCAMSQSVVTAATTNLLATSIISGQILPELQLLSQVNSDLNQLKNYYVTSSSVQFARSLIETNQIMTVYSLNWVYELRYSTVNYPIPTQPVSHGNCSCATSSSCTEPVVLNGQPISDFVLGCFPIESLLRSILVCLYNQACLDRINLGRLSVTPLNASAPSQFSPNMTVDELLANSFIE
jgi:hypothetical protein